VLLLKVLVLFAYNVSITELFSKIPIILYKNKMKIAAIQCDFWNRGQIFKYSKTVVMKEREKKKK
jgi:hypothetical protein